MGSLADALAALATMSPAQLRSEWRRVYRISPPQMTPDLLMRGIAFRLQERAFGSLPVSAVRQLEREAKRLERGDAPAGKPELRLKPGTRLVRSWNGTTYSVLVTDDAYLMGGRSFTSLTHVAEAITGAHWSGPRFFGLKPKRGAIGAAAQSAARRESAVAMVPAS
jgi:hypothetical protein